MNGERCTRSAEKAGDLLERLKFVLSTREIRRRVTYLTWTTSNGSIYVTLPANFLEQLDAKAGGRVTSDFPSPTCGTRKISQNRLVGQIGRGGVATVKLQSSNGSIYLKAQQ